MADDGVSMSLDDYIKTKKKGGGSGKRGGRGGGKPVARGKGQPGPSNKNTRYFNAGSGVTRGGNQAARGGRGRGGGQTQRSPRGGAKNRNFNVRNTARPSVQGAKRGGQRGAVLQQQRGRNRAIQGGPRRNRSQELIPRRRSPVKAEPRRRSPMKGSRGRGGRRTDRVELIPRNRLSTPVTRGGRVGRRGRGAALGRYGQVAARRPLMNPTNAVGRLRNRTVQKLVQKRIQRARLTLTRTRPMRGIMASGPRINTRNARTGTMGLTLRAALAQQKLGRARQARGGRGRGRAPLLRRGLLLDRTQNVRIRVRNEQSVPAGTYTGYRPDSSGMGGGGYNPLFPSQDHYDGDSFQFPRMVLNNSPSTSYAASAPSHAPFQEVLNPDIQKKIAMIQERGKPAETEVSPDFRFVSASRVKLGERFRSMMQ